MFRHNDWQAVVLFSYITQTQRGLILFFCMCLKDRSLTARSFVATCFGSKIHLNTNQTSSQWAKLLGKGRIQNLITVTGYTVLLFQWSPLILAMSVNISVVMTTASIIRPAVSLVWSGRLCKSVCRISVLWHAAQTEVEAFGLLTIKCFVYLR